MVNVQILGQSVPIVGDLDEIVDTTTVSPWDPIWAAIALLVGYILGRISRAMIRRYGRKTNLPANIVDLLGTLAIWVWMILAVIVALSFLGFTVAPFWVAVLIIAAVFVIAGRTFIENFGSGVLLQARAPFEPGDLVQLGEHTGVVKEVNSREVVLDAIDNRRVFIPNSDVLQSPIVNLTHRRLRMSYVLLDVEYGTDLDEACRVAAESLTDVPAVLSRPAPVAQVSSFEASAVRITLRFWHESDLLSEWNAMDAAARASYAAFADHGIVFAFPQATLWWGDDSDRTPPA